MNCSNYICDNRTSIPILAQRIFDNARLDLDRDDITLITSDTVDDPTFLYAGGTGSLNGPISGLSVTPSNNKLNICGNVSLPGNISTIVSGNRQAIPCYASLPICIELDAPESSVWPTNIIIDYSFFADNLKLTDPNTLTSKCDGVVIIYLTSRMPVCVPFAGSIQFNPLSSKEIPSTNGYATCDFYPFSQPDTAVFDF